MSTDDGRPRISAATLDRMRSVLSPKDAAEVFTYVEHMESRERRWMEDVLADISVNLRDLIRIAEKAEDTGRRNGNRIDTLSDLVRGYPVTMESILTTHTVGAFEKLRPLHEAAARAMLAEAAVTELETERARVEIDARRRAVEREHGGVLEVRALVVELVRRAPWAVILGALAMLAGGASLSELGHIITASLTGRP
jgi:hypothetical protein